MRTRTPGHTACEVIGMQPTQKEAGLLKDLKDQEQLCVDKYSRHAASAMAAPTAVRHKGCDSQLSPGRNTAPAYSAPTAAHKASLPLRRGIPASRAVVRSSR